MVQRSEPPRHNLLTDIAGVNVGHAHDPALRSGVTCVRFDTPATASCVVLGGAPGVRDTGALQPGSVVGVADAIVLSGGSAFGLDAASGVQAWMREQGRGFAVGDVRVPIVPQAICFDLTNGGDKDWGRYPPYRELGYDACHAATAGAFDLGTAGGGYGATTLGYKGGTGSASVVTSTGHTVAALVVVNALGSAVVAEGPHFWAAPFEIADEYGGLGWPDHRTTQTAALDWKGNNANRELATTLAVVATDATLDAAQIHRLAITAHDGLARALRLTHAVLDGDTVFAASTAARPLGDPLPEQIELGARAGDCVARAIPRAVYEAGAGEMDWPGTPSWRSVHGAH